MLGTIITFRHLLFMSRILTVLTILTLNSINGLAQDKDIKFDRLRISHNGDSLIKQEYELIIRTKKVYFLTPFASYLHIKGAKYRTRVKFDKVRKKRIFCIVDNLNWTNLVQNNYLINGNRFYIITTFIADKLISTYKVSEELLTPDFNSLYENISYHQ